MAWSRKAPKIPGYYWFLPSRPMSIWQTRSPQEPPTVMHRDQDGDWTFTGNDMTGKASKLHGRWWTKPLTPPRWRP